MEKKKPFIPVDRKEATEQTNSSGMDSVFLALYANPSCSCVICKTRKTNHFLRER